MRSSSGTHGNESACHFGRWGHRPVTVTPDLYQPTSFTPETPATVTPYRFVENKKSHQTVVRSSFSSTSRIAQATRGHSGNIKNVELLLLPGETGKLGPVSFSPTRTGKSYS